MPPRAATGRYGAPRSAAGPSGRNSSLAAGYATCTRSSRTPSTPVTSWPVYAELTNTDVTTFARCSDTCAPASSACGSRPFGMTERNEVVDRRRPDSGTLRREHPVREVEHVERAEKPLSGRLPGDAPRSSKRMGERHAPGAKLDVDSGERGSNPVGPRARGSECDDLVLGTGSLHEPAQRPADVVPDSEWRMGQRRDVERDLMTPVLDEGVEVRAELLAVFRPASTSPEPPSGPTR